MNEIVNKFLLAGDKFMDEMHLREPGFKYSAFGPFRKNKEKIQKFKETGDSLYIYQNKLDKAWLMEILKIYLKKQLLIKYCDKAFNIAKNSKNDGYHYGLASMIDKFFDKRTSGSGIKSTIISASN